MQRQDIFRTTFIFLNLSEAIRFVFGALPFSRFSDGTSKISMNLYANRGIQSMSMDGLYSIVHVVIGYSFRFSRFVALRKTSATDTKYESQGQPSRVDTVKSIIRF